MTEAKAVDFSSVRKSTRAIFPALTLTAIVPLAACGKHQHRDALIYQDQEACEVGNNVTACMSAYDAAVWRWQQEPGYPSQQACFAAAGVTCTPRSDGRFLEQMIGFTLAGDAVTVEPKWDCGGEVSAQQASQQNCSSGGGHVGGFVYYANGRFLRDATGASDDVIDEARARAAVARGDVSAVSDDAISHGGFGDAAGGHGGGGE